MFANPGFIGNRPFIVLYIVVVFCNGSFFMYICLGVGIVLYMYLCLVVFVLYNR